MGKLALTILIVVIVALVAGGIAYYLMQKGGISSITKGAVNITSIELYVNPEKVTEAQTPIEVHIGLRNSFPVNVKLGEGKLSLIVDDLKLVEINIPSQEIRKGSNTLVLNAIIDNTLIDEFWYNHLSRGEKSNITIQGYIAFKTPIGDIKLPVTHSRKLETSMFPVEKELNREYDLGPMGKVVIEKIRVDLVGVTPTKTDLKASITIRNELKTIPLYINGIVFRLKLGDGTILGTGQQEEAKAIAPGETDTITFNITLDNTKIPILWYKHIKNREHTKIIIEAWLKVKVAGKTIEIFKENPLTTTIEFKTNIFKYKT